VHFFVDLDIHVLPWMVQIKWKLFIKKNGAYSVGQKVGYSFMFATVIGIFIYWIVDYAKLPKADKQALKLAKVE
jgi:hypothetical protein